MSLTDRPLPPLKEKEEVPRILTPLDKARAVMVAEWEGKLHEVIDHHDSLARELYHLETAQNTLTYDPVKIKADHNEKMLRVSISPVSLRSSASFLLVEIDYVCLTIELLFLTNSFFASSTCGLKYQNWSLVSRPVPTEYQPGEARSKSGSSWWISFRKMSRVLYPSGPICF